MVKIVWMSDMHFEAEGDVAGYDPHVRLKAAVDYVAAHHGDAAACVISGDLVNHGTRANYAALRPYLERLGMPYLPMVGNHDDRAMLLAELPVPGDRLAGFVQYAVDLGAAVLLCLDTLKPGAVAGELCEARLDWVADQVARHAGRPVLVFMHHPPVALGLPAQDPDNLHQGSALLDLLAGQDNVQVFAGHVHRAASALARGLPLWVMKSVLFQAPAPWPAWDWSSFAPAREAPAIGIVETRDETTTLQYVEFCSAEHGYVG